MFGKRSVRDELQHKIPNGQKILRRRRKYLIIAFLTSIFSSVLLKILIPSVGTVSAFITICESKSLRPESSSLQLLCKAAMLGDEPGPSQSPPPPPIPAPPVRSSPSLQDEAQNYLFLGKWSGKWDNQWKVEFDIKKILSAKAVFGKYVHQEYIDGPMEAVTKDCEIVSKDKIWCPRNISIYFSDDKKAIAKIYNENDEVMRSAKLIHDETPDPNK